MSYDVPSLWKISWNQSLGSPPSLMGSSQAYLVLVLPSTRPQLMAPIFCAFNKGRMVKKVLPLLRAMYSVQIRGRPYALSISTRNWCCSASS